MIFCAVSPGLLRNCVIDSPSRPIDGAPDIYIYIYSERLGGVYVYDSMYYVFLCPISCLLLMGISPLSLYVYLSFFMRFASQLPFCAW